VLFIFYRLQYTVTSPWLTQLFAVPESGNPSSFQRFCGGKSGSGTAFCLNTARKFLQVKTSSCC